MATKKKSSKILALVLAIVMMFSIVPMSIFAAEADEVVLQNGKAAISSDMTDEQIKTALFNALVSNPEGKDPQAYEWEFFQTGYDKLYTRNAWGTIKGFSTWANPPGILWQEEYKHAALKDSGDTEYSLRIAGTTQEVRLTKVSSCNVTYNFDETQGKVTANGAAIAEGQTVTGVSPKAGTVVKVEPLEGYNIVSVKVNGVELAAKEDGSYEFVPVADTTVDVAFEEVQGTKSTLTLSAAQGVSYKVNGFNAEGSFRVSNAEETTVEFITDSNTSIDKVFVDGVDKTAEVVFANYNGTYKAVFAADSKIEVKTVKSAIELSGNTVVPVTLDSTGNWDYSEIRESVIDTLVSENSTIGNFDRSKLEVKYNCNLKTGEYYVDLGYDSAIAWEWTFWELFYSTDSDTPHNAKMRLCYLGDNQYRPTDYVYETITIDDKPTVSIAVRSGVQEFALEEIAEDNGYSYDFAKLINDIYTNVIDAANSTPKGVVNADTVKFQYYKESTWDTNKGWVDVDTRCPGGDHTHAGWFLEDVFSNGAHEFKFKAVVESTEDYYGSEKEFTIKLVADPIATAKIAIKDGYNKNFNLYQNYDRSFDTAAFEAALREKVIDNANCSLVNPADIMFSYDIKADGTYTVKAYAPETADYHYTEVTFEVVVDCIDNYTAEIVVDEANNSFNIVETGINTYDYAALKQAIVDQMFTINNVQGAKITADDIHFMYVIYDDGMLIQDYIEFEERYHAGDATETLYNYLHEGGTFKCWAELPADGETYYGDEVYFTINVTPAKLPKIDLEAKADQTVVLNYNKDRSFNYAQFKADIINNVLSVAGLPEGVKLTADDYEIQYKWTNGLWYQYDTIDRDCTVEFWAKIKDGNGYYGDEVYFNMTVVTNDEFTSKIALKDNYQRDFTLYYNAEQKFDYERLHKELFDAVIDTDKSSSNVTFENTVVTYDVTDGMAIHYPDSPLNTVGSDVGDPAETLFTYLHEGGTFTVKFAVPNSGGLFGNSVSVSLNIGPVNRTKTSVVLNGNAVMDYVASPAAIKQYIFDNVISKELSVLPEGVTVDDFVFEYWARKILAGGTPGAETDMGWAPFEGRDDIMGTYYKAIGAGDHYFRVYYKGNAEFEPSAWTSGYEKISLPKADFNISLKQDYIYRGDELPKDMIQVSDNAKGADINYRMLFTTTTNEGNALVYLQTRDGYSETDFTLWMNPVITDVFGADWTALWVLQNGLTIDQYKQLINSDRLYEHFAYWYGMDEADMATFREAALSRLGGMNHVVFRLGTPRHAAHYDVFVGAYNESFNTAAIHTGMYVKYNSKGEKLIWRESATGLNSINVKNFDFGADVTKDGISQGDGNVKYLYTGLFYCSSNAPRNRTGFFIQTAWTKAGSMYCFPQTRSFTIKLL